MAAGGRRHARIGERLQRKGHVRGRLKTLLRTFLETTIHHPLQSRGRSCRDLRNGRRILIQDCRHGFRRSRFTERLLARYHLIEDGAEGEDVRAVVGGLSAHLLGRHIAGGAHHHAWLGALGDSSIY